MIYKLTAIGSAIIKIDDDGIIYNIPNDVKNGDWQEYQAWLALGNTPDPA